MILKPFLIFFQWPLREAAAPSWEAAQGEDPRHEKNFEPGLRWGFHLLRGAVQPDTGEMNYSDRLFMFIVRTIRSATEPNTV